MNGSDSDVGDSISSRESQDQDEAKENNKKEVVSPSSYMTLILSNRPFRGLMMSYMITQAGFWFSYVASLVTVERILGAHCPRTILSGLVIVRLVPGVLLFGTGGILADSRDRRRSMIMLDLLGGVVALLLWLAYAVRSVVLLFVFNFLQRCVAAFYEPCRSAIVPMTVSHDEDLKKAVTLAGILWSLMHAVGSALGGFTVAAFGIPCNFVLDGFSFVWSAALLWGVGGTWNAAASTMNEETSMSPCGHIGRMAVGGIRYLSSVSFGPLVLMKASASFVFGVADVLNVSFAQHGQDGDSITTSTRLGILFGSVGVGCVVGCVLGDVLITNNIPSRLQVSCICWLGVVSIGCLGVGWSYPWSFPLINFFSAVRSAGSSVAWIHSSVLLQTLSSPQQLGRVVAVELTLAWSMESTAAFLAGILQDRAHWTAGQVSICMGVLGVLFVCAWTTFHILGGGAAKMDCSTTANNNNNRDDATVMDDSTNEKQCKHQQNGHGIDESTHLLANGEVKVALDC